MQTIVRQADAGAYLNLGGGLCGLGLEELPEPVCLVCLRICKGLLEVRAQTDSAWVDSRV